MRDISDTNALRLEIINEPELTLDFDCGQGGCRLVQNQDPGVLRPCLGNFDDRLLCQPQIPQRHFRVDVSLQPVKNFAGAQQLRLLVDVKPEPGRLALGKDIVGNGQFGKKAQFLKDNADPGFHRVVPGAELDRNTIDNDLAIRERFHPGGDFHQRRFAPSRSRPPAH